MHPFPHHTGVKTLIVYGSRTGNTALLAQRIKEVLEEAGWPVTLKNVTEAQVSEMTQYQLVLLGSSTYGDGDLWKTFLPFEAAMGDVTLEGIQGAAFGCGSARYPAFCWAADILENGLKNCGCRIVQKALKMDTLTGFEVRQADVWARWLIERV